LESATNTLDLEQSTRVIGSDGRYRAELSNAWEIWGPNGGYLATFALRAAAQVAQLRRPASLYCHFLSSPKFTAVDLDVQILKGGRRSESISVRMTQADKPILQALVRTVAEAPGFEHQHARAPDVPVPHELKSYWELWPNGPGRKFKFWSNLEGRPVDQTVDRKPQAAPRVDWTRFQPQACFDDVFVDAARSLILLDTFGWPAAINSYLSNEYVAPNLDTSVWFHQFNPQSEWLLIEHDCPIAKHGLMGVSGKVWDIDGKLLATGSAHLCCLPTQR
jgi:acyl-CoA thioesterase II